MQVGFVYPPRPVNRAHRVGARTFRWPSLGFMQWACNLPPAVESALTSAVSFSPAPRNPKTDRHRPQPPKAGLCLPWCLRRPPKPPRARRRHLVPRPDPSEPKRPPGSSPRRPPWSPSTETRRPSGPTARSTRVSVHQDHRMFRTISHTSFS